MTSRRVRSVGNHRDYPRQVWGPRDHEQEREEIERIGQPLPATASGAPPPPLKFSLHEPPVIGGQWSQAVDELIARHTGFRPRRRAR